VTAGIYDPRTRAHVCTSSYSASKLAGGYVWYPIGSFDPSALSDGAYLYVGDGYTDRRGRRFLPALYLDCLRFTELPAGTGPDGDGEKTKQNRP
jgi:hypothetical protein